MYAVKGRCNRGSSIRQVGQPVHMCIDAPILVSVGPLPRLDFGRVDTSIPLVDGPINENLQPGALMPPRQYAPLRVYSWATKFRVTNSGPVPVQFETVSGPRSSSMVRSHYSEGNRIVSERYSRTTRGDNGLLRVEVQANHTIRRNCWEE